MRSFHFLLYLALLSAACDRAQSSLVTNPSPKGPLSATFDAHGSLDHWKSFRTLTFDLISERGEKRDTQHISTDLQDRRELIRTATYDIGYDGTSYWKIMHDSSATNTDPRFMKNLQFYFFAMPFVLADPGVTATSLPPQSISNKMFDVIKITFGDSVGVAPKDQYILYVDPISKRLNYMLYSVTYFDPDRAEKYGALYYRDWQEVDGLLLPKVGERFEWNAEDKSLGKSRGFKRFQNVQLLVESKDSQFFSKSNYGEQVSSNKDG